MSTVSRGFFAVFNMIEIASDESGSCSTRILARRPGPRWLPHDLVEPRHLAAVPHRHDVDGAPLQALIRASPSVSTTKSTPSR